MTHPSTVAYADVHIYVMHRIFMSRTKWSNTTYFKGESPAEDRCASVGEVSTVICSSLYNIVVCWSMCMQQKIMCILCSVQHDTASVHDLIYIQVHGQQSTAHE